MVAQLFSEYLSNTCISLFDELCSNLSYHVCAPDVNVININGCQFVECM